MDDERLTDSQGASTRPWPSVEEQIAAAKVDQDSALAQLIRDNQDFHLLDPREASDDAGLPLWLRVYWRKTHPDLEHSTINPGGGYPDGLYTMHARMLDNPDLRWGAATNPMELRGGTR